MTALAFLGMPVYLDLAIKILHPYIIILTCKLYFHTVSVSRQGLGVQETGQ